MPFVIPSASSGSEGLILDGLDLAQGNGGAIMLDAFTPPIPKKRPEWIEAADSDGAILARAPLVSNGEATIRVAVPGVSRDDMQATVGTIVDKLNEADKTPEGIPLVWTPSDSTDSLTFYVLSGEVTEFPVDWESGYMANQAMVTLVLQCQPYGDGTPVTYTKTATAGPLITLDLTDVPGDARENNAQLTITDASTQSRRTVEWGAEHMHYDPASPWSLVLDSDNLVTTGFSGTASGRNGAWDSTGSSAGVSRGVIRSVVSTAAQAICGTGAQPHIGCFRVKLRTYMAGSSDIWIRLAWRVGDGDYRRNDPVHVVTFDRFVEVDLGLIMIPEVLSGTQSWSGIVEAYSDVGDDIEVDYLALFPVEAGYGKAAASYSYSPGVINARDSFTGTTAAVALNARVADAGGTWTTSGSATDFVFIDTVIGVAREAIQRSTTSDASARFAVLGSTNYTNVEMSGTIYMDAANSLERGWFVRWTDSNNYLRGVVTATTALGVLTWSLSLIQRVAGVATTIATTTIPASSQQSAVYYTLRLIAFTSGRTILQLLDSTATGTLASVEASSTDLATGGTLATGKPGVYDFNSSSAASTRVYDDISVSTPATEPIVLYSGRSLQIRHDDTERESSTGGTWGRPQSYRGSRFKVQPAGSADRTTRIAIKASRNELDTAEDTNLTDTISLSVSVTPRYTVIPRS